MHGDILALLLVVGLGTYLLRCLPLVGLTRRRLSPGIEGWLRYIGPAVLGALIASGLLTPQHGLGFSAAGRGALLPTAAVARLTRNLPFATLVGVVAYGLLHAWLG